MRKTSERTCIVRHVTHLVAVGIAACVPFACSGPADVDTGASGGALSGAVVATLQAPAMPTKTTGGAACNGACWNIWSDGYIAATVNFPSSGNYEFDVSAYASLAQGVGADMEVRIDGAAIASVVVNATTMTTYTVQGCVSAGAHQVAIAFTNDYEGGGQDRNLYVEQIIISSTSSSTCMRRCRPPA